MTGLLRRGRSERAERGTGERAVVRPEEVQWVYVKPGLIHRACDCETRAREGVQFARFFRRMDGGRRRVKQGLVLLGRFLS